MSIHDELSNFRDFILNGSYNCDLESDHAASSCPVAAYLNIGVSPDAVGADCAYVGSMSLTDPMDGKVYDIETIPWVNEFLDLWDYPEGNETDEDMACYQPARYLRRCVEQLDRLAMHGLLIGW